jgi:hypothetical protein
MLYLRTASGSFVAATIVQLSPQRADGTDEITSWVAICGDGKAVALAAYYAAPGGSRRRWTSCRRSTPACLVSTRADRHPSIRP